MTDLAIIGSGPAALTAAIYASRSGLSVEIFEKKNFGGALTEIADIENFPGFSGAGSKLAENLKNQAQSFGVNLSYGSCTNIEKIDDHFELLIDEEKRESKTVLVATGTEPTPLSFGITPPVSYCAICDGPLYKGKNIAVVGGGNSAVGEAIYLSGLVNHLTLFNRSNLRAEKELVDALKKHQNVDIRENIDISSDLLNNFDAVFAFIGKRPSTTFLNPSLLDNSGMVITDNNNMTKIPGLFAAGDVRAGTLKQAVTAAADGAVAAHGVALYLKMC